MKSASVNVALLLQSAGSSMRLYNRLNELLAQPSLVLFRAAVAYARWDGLGLISRNLERYLAVGGEFQCIYGVNNGVTTPDSFLYSLYLQKIYKGHSYAGAVEDKYVNATFHPKFFEFKFKDDTVAILGSANLTGGGLVRNTEICAEIKTKNYSPLFKQIEACWDALAAEGEQFNLKKIRGLTFNKKLSSEEDEASGRGNPTNLYLDIKAKIAVKPLFSKILELKEPKKKKELLSDLDLLTKRPKRLYLQIFEKETGGNNGGQGYQIQLPASTLPMYFGISPDEGRIATFKFKNEDITIQFRHFTNNTHRVRLRPILDAERPAVLVFERIGADTYRCEILPSKDYANTLSQKCDQQTRTGARRWGME